MTEPAALMNLTTGIVAAYVGNHALRVAELAELIASTHGALVRLAEPAPLPEPAPTLQPAVPVKKSITPEYLICLDDGKRFKSLKRHLAQLGMSPDEYRTRWGLPRDYPMVAPGYASRRSELARAIGLGTTRKVRAEAAALLDHTALAPVEPEPATLAPVLSALQPQDALPEPTPSDQAPKRRGRPRKTQGPAAAIAAI